MGDRLVVWEKEGAEDKRPAPHEEASRHHEGRETTPELDRVFESNLRIKQAMAAELIAMGLSREAVERVLNMEGENEDKG